MSIRILLVMLSLSPSRGDADLAFRTELAEAIAAVTDDEVEQNTLARIAYYESHYRRAVASCVVTGDHGRSRGVFQVQGRTAYDREASCGSLQQQAEVAVRYVRMSAAACPNNTGAMRLAVYVSGRCDRGHAQARLRWGAP